MLPLHIGKNIVLHNGKANPRSALQKNGKSVSHYTDVNVIVCENLTGLCALHKFIETANYDGEVTKSITYRHKTKLV